VIAHGLDRNTHDADIWLDPLGSPAEWVSAVNSVIALFPTAQAIRIARLTPIEKLEYAEVIENEGVCRIDGLERPLDIFRKPNETEIERFEDVWELSKLLEDGTRLPDVIDLLLTKQDTGRDKDNYDIAYLEGKATNHYLQELPFASKEKALKMLERFLTPKIAALAMQHSESEVRIAGQGYLKELVEAGDPYAAEIMRQIL